MIAIMSNGLDMMTYHLVLVSLQGPTPTHLRYSITYISGELKILSLEIGGCYAISCRNCAALAGLRFWIVEPKVAEASLPQQAHLERDVDYRYCQDISKFM